jgi:hypothetical protein
MSNSLSQRTKLVRLFLDGSAYYHAGTAATYTSEYIDTAGYAGVRFTLSTGLGVNTGTLDFHLTECDIAGGSYTAVTGATNVTTALANGYLFETANGVVGKNFSIEVCRPTKRYLRAVTVVGTQTCVLQALNVELFNRVGSNPDTSAVLAATGLVTTPIVVESV